MERRNKKKGLTICFSVYLLDDRRLTASMWPKSMSWPRRKMKSNLQTYFFFWYPSRVLSPLNLDRILASSLLIRFISASLLLPTSIRQIKIDKNCYIRFANDLWLLVMNLQFRMSEMKTAKPLIPSPLTAGILRLSFLTVWFLLFWNKNYWKKREKKMSNVKEFVHSWFETGGRKWRALLRLCTAIVVLPHSYWFHDAASHLPYNRRRSLHKCHLISREILFYTHF